MSYLIPPSVAVILVAVCVWPVPGTSDQSPAQRADTLGRYELDPASPLESRIKPASPAVLKMFADAELPTPTAHAVTPTEQRRLSAAIAALPPLHRRMLAERLRSMSFLDGMPNTALTSTVNQDEPYRLFDITFRGASLARTCLCFSLRKSGPASTPPARR